MAVDISISNIVYLKKPVKDYQKPFRFTLTVRWVDEQNREHGSDTDGCLGGVDRMGVAEWRGPMFWLGRQVAYTVTFAPGTYEVVLKALTERGYFKVRLDDLLPKQVPVSAEEEVGLPGAFAI